LVGILGGFLSYLFVNQEVKKRHVYFQKNDFENASLPEENGQTY
jgi:hypothetical protein